MKRRNFILRKVDGLELDKEPLWLIRFAFVVVGLSLIGIVVGFGRTIPVVSKTNISQVAAHFFPVLILLPSIIVILRRIAVELRRRKSPLEPAPTQGDE